MNDVNRWRTPAFRKRIIEKIDEEILKLNSLQIKSAQELENEVFLKAATEKEYSSLIARLIYDMRCTKPFEGVTDISKSQTAFTVSQQNSPMNPQSFSGENSSTNSTRKNHRSLVCAVCCSTFPNKRSIKNHIKNTQHMVSNSLPQFLLSMLPQEWKFTICNHFKTLSGYKLELCLPRISSVELTQEWMKAFAKLNDGAFVWERSCSTKNTYNQKITYGCRYTERKPDKPHKSKITFTIKSANPSYSLATLDLDYNQSPTFNDDSRQYHPSAEVKEILFKYFKNATNATEAYRNFQLHIEMQFETENDYLEYISDRHKMPALSWVRQLYNSLYQGPQSMQKDDLEILEKFVHDKNEECGECVCKFQELANDNFVLLIVTAFMKRALESRAAGELIYTDNVGSAAQHGLKVYLILTNIKGEAVPLAVLISSSETNKAIKLGFNLFSAYVDDQSFNSKGKLGPSIIMTDDSIAEMASMKSLFPYSKIVLSAFHFLRACHKWLIKIEHKISKQNREIIYAFVRRMVYATSESTLRIEFDQLMELFKNNDLVSAYVCKLHEKRQTWALCYRRNFISMNAGGNRWKQTLSFLKEQISSRIKLQEPKRLVLYFLNEFCDFYRRRLIDCALDRFTNERRLEDCLENYEITRSVRCESLFTVRDRKIGVKYSINTDINSCTCYVGSGAGLCEHQIILNTFLTGSNIGIVGDTQTKLELYYIVSGCKDVPEEFFGLSNQENCYRISDQPSQTEQFFDNCVTEETIIEGSQDTHIPEETNFNQTLCQQIEIEREPDEKQTPQVYPIIIDNNVEDESIVQIDESSSLDHNIRVQSVPKIIYSIVVDENNDTVETETVFDDIDEESTDRFEFELNKFRENFNNLRGIISKNPATYEYGLRFLNNQLKKVKNDPAALLQALSSFKS